LWKSARSTAFLRGREEVLSSCFFVHTAMAREPIRNFFEHRRANFAGAVPRLDMPRLQTTWHVCFFEKPFGLRFPRDFAFGCSLIFL